MNTLATRWGSFHKFQEPSNAMLLEIKGSGWGQLAQDLESGSLEIVTSNDEDMVPAGKKPLLGIDMWEHAFYLQYWNNNGAYAKGIWKVVNWKKVEARFDGGPGALWGAWCG